MKRREKIMASVGTLFWNILFYGGLFCLVLNLAWPAAFPGKNVLKYDRAQTWFSDRFVGRGPLFTWSFLGKRLSGIQQINGVYVSWSRLLQQPESLTEQQARTFAQAVNAFAAKARCPVSVMIIPSAAAIYPDKVPAGAQVPDEPEAIQALYRQLDGVQGIGLQDVLQQHRKEGLYYRTDPRWTSRGAGYGAQVLADQLGWPSLDLDSVQDLCVSRHFQGPLSSLTGDPFLQDAVDLAVPDDLPEYVMERDGKKYRSMYMEQALEEKDKYKVFTGPDTGIVRFEMDNDSDVRLMIVKDSYANSLVQYLIPYCRTITLADPRYLEEDLARVMERDMVTQLVVAAGWDSLAGSEALTNCFEQLPSNQDMN